MRNGDIMKTIGMATAAFLVACGASAAHGAFERGGNTKDSSADEIAKYEAVAGLPRDPNEKTVEPPKIEPVGTHPAKPLYATHGWKLTKEAAA